MRRVMQMVRSERSRSSRKVPLGWLCLLAALVTSAGAGTKSHKTPPKALEGSAPLKPHQRMSVGETPQSPSEFTPDPPISAPPQRLFPEEPKLDLSTRISTNEPPTPPVVFN